jgi:hypothetical protein
MNQFELPEQIFRTENPQAAEPEPAEDGTPGKKKTGPAPILLDPKQVFQLAQLGATNVEIARFFNVSESFIRKRYSDVCDSGRCSIKIRLRQAQIREAMAGNVTMLIWLGKQMLNQSDQGERNSDENQPLPWSDND